MENEMIKRVADAIFRASGRLDYAAARVAIAAMREPTEAMTEAGAEAILTGGDWPSAKTVWNAMTEAALTPPRNS